MKGTYIVYTNFNREGWKVSLRTQNRQTFEYLISQLKVYDEPVAVIAKYKTDRGDYPLVSFYSRSPQKRIDLEKAYKLLPKD